MSSRQLFERDELRRVGVAATMIVVCGTVIIIAMTMMLGHYNSLAHSGPKAALDGCVIALLMSKSARWRCLWLLGVVYGLVLLLQVGIFYLFPIMVIAGAFSAGAGWALSRFHRTTAIVVAAMLYEWLSGFGSPIKIYFATNGKSEPFVWMLWMAEWPMRIGGAAIGVWLAAKWKSRASISPAPIFPVPRRVGGDQRRIRQRRSGSPTIAIIACAIACIIPLWIESIWRLAALAVSFSIYAIWMGAGRRVMHALLGLLGGWALFSLLSYSWNHDVHRIVDMGRTLVLRFTPIAMSSIALMAAVRPVDLMRFLRKCGIGAIVLLPLSMVLRSIPQTRAAIRQSFDELRAGGQWRGPISLLSHPILIIRSLVQPHWLRWASALSDEHVSIESSQQTRS